MNSISSKKCPICYSVLSTKVDFCPICGTELQTQLEEKKEPTYSKPSSSPITPRSNLEEEIFTTNSFEISNSEEGQYAWKIAEERLPLRVKGHIKYSNKENPKVDFKYLKKLGYFNIALTCLGGIVISFFLLSLIGFSGLILFYKIQSVKNIILLILSLVGFCLSSFFLSRYLGRLETKDSENKSSYRKFLPYLFFQGLHVLFVSALIVGGWQIIRSFEQNSSTYSVFYSVSIIFILILSLFSPPLKIAKLFTNIRNSGLFQNFYDASQIHKFSVKRTIQLVVLSFLVPALSIMGGMNSIIKIYGYIFLPGSEILLKVWDSVIFVSVLVFLTLTLAFTTISDMQLVSSYERLLAESITPPKINWLSRKKEFTHNQEVDEQIEITNQFNDSGVEEREYRCPSCSAILVEGAEFCTDCGKKIVK